MNLIKTICTLQLLIGITFSVSAQKDLICKIWYNQEKTSKLEVYQTGNNFEAKIIWLNEPLENGKPKMDKENPDEKLRNTPIVNLVIMHNIHKSKDTPNFYDGGKIYDPKNGKTYDCRLTYKGSTIELRGYVLGLPFLGRTSTWWLAEGQ